jgi:predicted dehydrogenase
MNRADNRDPHVRTAADEINVAIVGLGYWGPNLLRALSEIPDVRPTHICDLDEARLARFAQRYPATTATPDVELILNDPAVDAVIIATPLDSHHSLALRCLEAGKHTFVEKPLSRSVESAEELFGIARDLGLTLMCGHTFLYSPPVHAIKEILDSGELGEIYFMSCSRVNLGPYRPDVSVIWDLAPHDFSILLYWLEALPEWVSAVGRDYIVNDILDVAFIDLMFPGGLLTHAELSWLAPSKLRRTMIVGSEKMIVYEDGTPEPVRVFDSGIDYRDPENFGEYYLAYRSGDIISPRIDSAEPLVSQLQDFIDAIKGKALDGTQERISKDVIRLIEAAEWSLANDGARTSLEAPVDSVRR